MDEKCCFRLEIGCWILDAGASAHLLCFPQRADAFVFRKIKMKKHRRTVVQRILKSGKRIKGRDRDWAEPIIKLCIKWNFNCLSATGDPGAHLLGLERPNGRLDWCQAIGRSALWRLCPKLWGCGRGSVFQVLRSPGDRIGLCEII